MKTAAQYIADAKEKLGDARMSDRELGERLGGLSQQYVAGAKKGKMTDPLAMKIAEVLGVQAGELLMVARMEREKDPEVRLQLERWVETVGKALARAAVALVAALGLMWHPRPAEAHLAEAEGFASSSGFERAVTPWQEARHGRQRVRDAGGLLALAEAAILATGRQATFAHGGTFRGR